ncbi:DUF2712 domain-containing protein [Bacillus inaquosorum]
MKKFLKNNFRFLLAATLGISLLASSNFIKASNDNHKFHLFIPYGYKNAYTNETYRQTTHTDNPWKVNLQKSEEGKGTIMTFWLISTRYSKTPKASNTHNVKQGSGAHYYHANSKASDTYVALAAENNNYGSEYYAIDGVWDEETW